MPRTLTTREKFVRLPLWLQEAFYAEAKCAPGGGSEDFMAGFVGAGQGTRGQKKP